MATKRRLRLFLRLSLAGTLAAPVEVYAVGATRPTGPV